MAYSIWQNEVTIQTFERGQQTMPNKIVNLHCAALDPSRPRIGPS